jgi:DNA-binding MarR family transcriptional regulator
MFWGGTPEALSARFAAVAQHFIADGRAERADRAKRNLLAAVASHEPATLNQVAKTVGRGAPAVSRSIDALVRVGFIERTADPNNRRRLAMRLTESGREMLTKRPKGGAGLFSKLERLAPSELRAVERAIEILERS